MNKNINNNKLTIHYTEGSLDIHIDVSKEVAEFLEKDRKRQEALERKNRMYVYGSLLIEELHQDLEVDIENQYIERHIIELLEKAISKLTKEEQELLEFYYELDFTLKRIEKLVNMPISSTQRILKKSLKKLKISMGKDVLFGESDENK